MDERIELAERLARIETTLATLVDSVGVLVNKLDAAQVMSDRRHDDHEKRITRLEDRTQAMNDFAAQVRSLIWKVATGALAVLVAVAVIFVAWVQIATP